MAKHRKHRKHKSRGSRRRGTSGLAGLGFLRGETGKALLPPVVAGALVAGTTLGIREFVNPLSSEMAGRVYKNAPYIGIAVGLLGSVGLYYLKGKQAAVAGATSALLQGGILAANEALLSKKSPVNQGVALAPSTQAAATPAAIVAGAGGGAQGLRALGAVVPEYASMNGLDGIVMERVNGLGAMGDDVNLRGTVNQSAFGTSSFGGN